MGHERSERFEKHESEWRLRRGPESLEKGQQSILLVAFYLIGKWPGDSLHSVYNQCSQLIWRIFWLIIKRGLLFLEKLNAFLSLVRIGTYSLHREYVCILHSYVCWAASPCRLRCLLLAYCNFVIVTGHYHKLSCVKVASTLGYCVVEYT